MCKIQALRAAGLSYGAAGGKTGSSHGEGTHGGLEVVAITGHKDPRMLMRSTHLKVEDLVSKVTMEKGAG